MSVWSISDSSRALQRYAIRRATGLSLALRSGTIGSESGRCDAQLHPAKHWHRRCAATVGRLALACVIAANSSPEAARAADGPMRRRSSRRSVPALIEVFKPAAVSVTMRNTGTARGSRRARRRVPRHAAAAGQLLLVHPGQPARHVQRQPRAASPRRAAGRRRHVRVRRQAAVVRFAATAPFRFRMLSQTHGTFGEETPAATIVVSTAAAVRVATGAGYRTRGRHHSASGRVQEHDRRHDWRSADGYALGFHGTAGRTRHGAVSRSRCRADVAPGATGDVRVRRRRSRPSSRPTTSSGR